MNKQIMNRCSKRVVPMPSQMRAVALLALAYAFASRAHAAAAGTLPWERP